MKNSIKNIILSSKHACVNFFMFSIYRDETSDNNIIVHAHGEHKMFKESEIDEAVDFFMQKVPAFYFEGQ
jgi:hypothetical protein